VVNGNAVFAPTTELNVLDRVAVAMALRRLYLRLLSGETPEQAIKLGWAHGALMTTFPVIRRWRR